MQTHNLFTLIERWYLSKRWRI